MDDTDKSDTSARLIISSLGLVISGLTLIILSYITEIYPELLQPLGLSLITAAILSITLDSVSLRGISEDVKRAIRYSQYYNMIKSCGITSIMEMTPYDEIDACIKNGQKFIIVQTYFPHLGSTVEHLSEMLSRGGAVEIYLLDPESEFSKQRARDLNRPDDYVCTQTKLNTYEIKSLHRSLEEKGISTDKLKLFHFRRLPAFSLHIVDNTVWMGFYWYGGQSDFGMNIVADLRKGTHLKGSIDRHLANIAKDAIEVNIREPA